MNRMDALIAQRRVSRQAAALAAAHAVIRAAEEADIAVALVGSLARGDFAPHSDVDLLVRGPLDSGRRRVVERLAAEAMRAPGLDYDLIFEDDLSPERVREFLHDAL
ncbi:Predicted nucleotidyltransferase [Rhizobium sp. RU20A]|uniref:nucleotidyltransferase family protein n=1 Tax=Rhizobium sp. RU20A TaxID=1907412 RepID=UPI000954EEF4|nr:nucleotidyltransferase domain-containing protein [Rhizobium sp. RU20A]SIR15906.1 Predicted nucleotidyltransferase [Rhizobium sp. RU20A]